MPGGTGGDSNGNFMQIMVQMMEAQRQQNELMKNEMESQKEQMKQQNDLMKVQMEKQNKAIEALLSERPEKSDTRSEMSDGLRHRGPSIDALEKQIRNFSYNPEDGVTFDSWMDRHREIFENDLNDMDDGDKGRLLLRHMDDKVYKQFRDHIRPKKPSDLKFEEILTIMNDLFGDKKSEFEKRLDVFNLKMSKLKCDDIKKFSGIVNRVVEEANIKDMPLEQFKAIVMLAGMDLPRHTATMFHVMNEVRSSETPTIDSILNVVNVYKEVYSDAHAVSKQNDPQVNAVRNHGRFRDHRPSGSNADEEKRCDGCGRYHLRSECPHISSVCFNCNEVGHLSPHCKKDKVSEQKIIGQERRVNVIVSECIERNTSFDVEVQLNGRKVTMVADTGSDLTIISEKVWRELGKPRQFKTDEKAVCANGLGLSLKGVCHMCVEVNGIELWSDVFITNSKMNVLGKDNFRKFFQLIPKAADSARKLEIHKNKDGDGIDRETSSLNADVQSRATQVNANGPEKATQVKSVSQDEAPNVNAVGQDEALQVKTVRQDEAPQEKSVSQDEAPNVNAVGQDEALQVKTVRQDEAPQEKSVSQDEAPNVNAVGQDEALQVKTVRQDEAPQEKTVSQDEAPDVKTPGSGSTGNSVCSTVSSSQDEAPRNDLMARASKNDSVSLHVYPGVNGTRGDELNGEVFVEVHGNATERNDGEAIGKNNDEFEDAVGKENYQIFGYEGEVTSKITHANWVSSMLKGLVSLEYYNAEKQKWGQAHSWARFVLLNVVLETGQGFVTIEETKDASGGDDLKFTLDKTKIETVGVKAVREFLKKLQAYKSTADLKKGTELFNKYGTVGPTALAWREIVIAKRKPKFMFVQPNTKINRDGEVELVTYPETPEGIIQSVVERFSAESMADLQKLWEADQKHFPRAYGKC